MYAGIDQGLDYQPSKLKIWVRIPLPVAHLVELVDTIDSNSVPTRGIGSTPMVSTIHSEAFYVSVKEGFIAQWESNRLLTDRP